MCRCPNTNTTDCIQSPFEAIAAINNVSTPSDGSGWTKTAAGCDVFDKSQSGFAAALALAEEADYVVVGLGISDCGPDSPIDSGTCYKHSSTAQYEYPDGFMEMEAHDRTSIDLPPTQQAFAKAVLALNKPTVVFLLNAGAVSIDDIASHAASASAPLAIIEAFYPGLRGAQALAEGIFGDMNAWGRLPFTIYPSSFATEAAMTEHDLRVAPGRTYRYHREPQFAFGTGLSLTNWSLTGDAPACLAALSTSTPAQVIPTPSHVLDRISPIFFPFSPVFCAFSPPRRDGSNEPQARTQGQETVSRVPKHRFSGPANSGCSERMEGLPASRGA